MALSSIIKKTCSVCGKVAIERSVLVLGSSRIITLECGHLLPEHSISSSADGYSSLRSKNGEALMPFQIDGIKFAEQANGCALIADEQGLGKTVQVLGLAALHFEELTPAVVVAKTTLKAQWFHQIMNWTGTKLVQTLDSSKALPIPGFDFYIVTYDILKNEHLFDEIEVKTVIIDECQVIKNHLSARAKAVQKLAKTASHIIALSGTPIKNHAGEYFTILNILRPTKFPEYQRYLREYCDSYDSFYSTKVGGLSNPERFHEVTKDFIIRRTQEEVLPDLFSLKQPRKFHHVELDRRFNKAYAAALDELDEIYYGEQNENSMSATIAIMGRLRKITGMSKTAECLDFVTDFLLSTDRRICIFAHHHSVVDKLEIEINKWLLDGNFTQAVVLRAGDDSSKKVAAFRDSRVMICSTLAAGEGMDGLQHLCNDMIILERQWNPANEEQVEGRLARIGQTKPVNFVYMLASETIDDYFTELVEQKRVIVAQTLDKKDLVLNEQSLLKELAGILVTRGRAKWRL